MPESYVAFVISMQIHPVVVSLQQSWQILWATEGMVDLIAKVCDTCSYIPIQEVEEMHNVEKQLPLPA